MRIKSILAAAAIALVAGLGSASAGDEFATLDGIAAQPMDVAEMEAVTGKLVFVITADLSTPAVIINGLTFPKVSLFLSMPESDWQIAITGFPG